MSFSVIPFPYITDGPAINAGNSIMKGKTNVLSGPITAAVKAAWPNTTILLTQFGSDPITPGVKMVRKGVLQPLPLVGASITTGVGAIRRNLTIGTASDVDLTGLFTTSAYGGRFIPGLAMSLPDDPYIIQYLPSQVLLEGQSGPQSLPLLNIGRSASSAFGYIQTAQYLKQAFDGIRTDQADAALSISATSPGTLTSTLPLGGYWNGTTGDHAILFRGVCDMKLELMIDPSLMDNQQNVDTDLYIFIPYSLSPSYTYPQTNNRVGAGYANKSFTNMRTWDGAYCYLAVPLQAIKLGLVPDMLGASIVLDPDLPTTSLARRLMFSPEDSDPAISRAPTGAFMAGTANFGNLLDSELYSPDFGWTTAQVAPV